MPLVLLKADPRARLRPCLRCGYSLRNITDARNCPECGLAIRLSLSGDHALDVSKPEWVRGLAVAIALAVVPHLLVLAVVLAALVQAAGGTRAVFVFRILGPSAVVVFAVGAYLIVRGAVHPQDDSYMPTEDAKGVGDPKGVGSPDPFSAPVRCRQKSYVPCPIR